MAKVEAPTRTTPDESPKAGRTPEPAATSQGSEAEERSTARPSRKRRRLLWIIPILLIVGAVAVQVALRFWYESTYFVMTDNAQITGNLVQVGSLNAGRVVSTSFDVGQEVQKNQTIATVAVPQQVGTVPLSDQPILDQTGSSNAQVQVRSPINGVVAAVLANAGATVTAGGPIYALVDPHQVWISANIDEDKVSRVQVGQAVEISSVALGRTFPGRVEAVTPASAATFSLLPAQNLSGNFNKVTQWVPVKIAVDSGDAMLPLGTSVGVRIRVKDD
jgi:multidrug resistance efflux pump